MKAIMHLFHKCSNCLFDVGAIRIWREHYGDVIMGTMASEITSLTSVYSTVYSGADQRKHQSSASLAFVPGIHRGPVNSPHKWPVMRKIFPFDDVIMITTKANIQINGLVQDCSIQGCYGVGRKNSLTFPWHFPDCQHKFQSLSQYIPCGDFSNIFKTHDDVIKWKHFPRYWPFVRDIHRPRWIPPTKASDAGLWWFLWSTSD